MLVVSSLLTLGVANIIGTYFEAGADYSYTADQWILLFPVSIMSGIAMVFITGILSVNLKTPRQGLYVSTLIGIAFLIPPLLIVYLAPDKLLWSMIYFVLLLLGNALCVRGILRSNHPPTDYGKVITPVLYLLYKKERFTLCLSFSFELYFLHSASNPEKSRQRSLPAKQLI